MDTPEKETNLKTLNIQQLNLELIRSDCGTQIRVQIDEDTVADYTGAMSEGAEFPPLIVFHDGNRHILADGFHRLMAARRCGKAHLTAEVRQGTKSDALRFALRANAQHGLKRSNADKRRSVELALEEWPTLSNREIARVCAVDESLVRDVRSLNCGNPAVEQPRIGADGKVRRLPVSSIPPARPCPEQPAPAARAAEHGGEVPSAMSSCPASQSQQKADASRIRELPPGLIEELRDDLIMVRDDAIAGLEKLNTADFTRELLNDIAMQQFHSARFLRRIVQAMASDGPIRLM